MNRCHRMAFPRTLTSSIRIILIYATVEHLMIIFYHMATSFKDSSSHHIIIILYHITILNIQKTVSLITMSRCQEKQNSEYLQNNYACLQDNSIIICQLSVHSNRCQTKQMNTLAINSNPGVDAYELMKSKNSSLEILHLNEVWFFRWDHFMTRD